MDRGAWKAAVHGIAEGRTRLSDLHFHFSLSCVGEGNGNGLQYSCPENPRDRDTWWAAIYGVVQSRTRLKWLSSSSSENPRCSPSKLFLKYFLTFYKVRYFFLFCLWFCMLVFWGMNNSRLEAQVIDNTNLVGVMDSCMHQEFCFVGSFTEKHFAPCVLFLGSHSKS